MTWLRLWDFTRSAPPRHTNLLPYGISKYNHNKLQRAKMFLACIALKRHLLRLQLHCLSIIHRIDFKLATLTFKVLSTTVLGCLNVRSMLNKFYDIVELRRDRRIDLLCLTESWHDSDSAILGRMHRAGFNVID